MKIVQVCPYTMELPGGVAAHVRDLSAALANLGHDVTIISPRPDQPHETIVEMGMGLRNVRVSNGFTVPFNKTSFEITYANRTDRRIIDEVITNDVDIVHYHTIFSPFLNWQAFRGIRAPRVATFHDVPPEGVVGATQRRLYPFVLRRLLPRFDAIIVASRALQDHIDLSLAYASRILPPCVDLSRFGPSVGPAIHFDDDKINILYLSRLEPRKGPMVLLEAYRLLCEQGLPVRLLLVGGGPDQSLVESFIKTNQLPNIVSVGPIEMSKTPAWFAACDIFCAPSLYGEGFGIVLIEAMTTGKPVVAADNAGYRQLLSECEGQFITPVGDSLALATCLRNLVQSADLRQRAGVSGRIAAARYDARQLAPRFLELYSEAINVSRARHGRRVLASQPPN